MPKQSFSGVFCKTVNKESGASFEDVSLTRSYSSLVIDYGDHASLVKELRRNKNDLSFSFSLSF